MSTLIGLAVQCKFGTQSKLLAYDKFLTIMRNVTLQELPPTEPMDQFLPGVQFAATFEEVIMREKLYGVELTYTNQKKAKLCVKLLNKEDLTKNVLNVAHNLTRKPIKLERL